MENTFKRSNITEMCKQISSAPVVFKMNDGTECLAFYNNEDSIQATKLYILFPNTSIPKYIEGNDLYGLRECIIHSITRQKALELYNKVNKTHKGSTISFITSLINKAKQVTNVVFQSILESHKPYNKKHACATVIYKGQQYHCYAKDLLGLAASEFILENDVLYNVTFDKVIWAAGISSKDFTLLKAALKQLRDA